MVEVIFSDVDGHEVKAGPFDQVVFELDVVGPATRAVIKEVSTSEPIAWGYAGFWYRDDRPFKRAFVQHYDPERS